MIRAQPFTSDDLHSTAGRSHPIVPCTGRFFDGRLAFGSGNMLPDCSNFECGSGNDADL